MAINLEKVVRVSKITKKELEKIAREKSEILNRRVTPGEIISELLKMEQK